MPKVQVVLEIDFGLLPDSEIESDFLEDATIGEGEDERPMTLDEYKQAAEEEPFEAMRYAECIADNMLADRQSTNQFFFGGSDLDHEIKGARVVSATVIPT